MKPNPSSKLSFIQWLNNYNLPIILERQDEEDLYKVYLHLFNRFLFDQQDCIVRRIAIHEITWDYTYYSSDGKANEYIDIGLNYVRFLKLMYKEKHEMLNDYDLRLWSLHFSDPKKLIDDFLVKDETSKFLALCCLSIEYLVFELFDLVNPLTLEEFCLLFKPAKRGVATNFVSLADAKFCYN